MPLSATELSSKAKEINDRIFGPTREAKPDPLSALKVQLDESAKFAMQKALSEHWVSPSERDSFLAVLKERPDAVNLFIVGDDLMHKSIEMLMPIFGYKSARLLGAFRESFNALQEALKQDRQAAR